MGLAPLSALAATLMLRHMSLYAAASCFSSTLQFLPKYPYPLLLGIKNNLNEKRIYFQQCVLYTTPIQDYYTIYYTVQQS